MAEVVAQTGVTAHTLRYYERIGLLDCPRADALAVVDRKIANYGGPR